MAWLQGTPRAVTARLHRWAGLLLGPLFVLLGLTGSLLVFYVGLDERIEPALAQALARPGVPAADAPWQPVWEALQRAHPQRQGGWRIEIGPQPTEPLVTARYLKPAETEGAFFAPLITTVDRRDLSIVADRFWGRTVMTWIYDLHFTLLMGEAGLWVVGTAGLLLALTLLGGLLLWWPRRGQAAAALRVKTGAGAMRRWHDLHKLAGLAGGGVLLVLALTGAALAVPAWVEPLVLGLGTQGPPPRVMVEREPGRPLLGLDQALAIARQALPGAVPRWVDTPSATRAVWGVRLAQAHEPSRRFPRTRVWIDAHTGEVLAVHAADGQRAGDVLEAWLHPLHNGEAFGLAGRLIVVLAGAFPLLMALSGALRWWHRRRAVHQGRARRDRVR
jgi:uncharacterized iron-regulated membrane protein